MPKSAHDEPPLQPETDRGRRGEDKEGRKQVERGKSPMRGASVKMEPFVPALRKGSERHEGIS